MRRGESRSHKSTRAGKSYRFPPTVSPFPSSPALLPSACVKVLRALFTRRRRRRARRLYLSRDRLPPQTPLLPNEIDSWRAGHGQVARDEYEQNATFTKLHGPSGPVFYRSHCRRGPPLFPVHRSANSCFNKSKKAPSSVAPPSSLPRPCTYRAPLIGGPQVS